MSKKSKNIDTSKLEKLFDELDEKIQTEILIKGLKAGGNKLAENTREIMLQKVSFSSTAKGGAKKPMAESVKVITDKNYNEVIVSLMSNYLNIFFEKGTDKRYRKIRGVGANGKRYRKDNTKSGYTGKIDGYYFFKEAREDNEEVVDKIRETINKQLIKLMK